MKCDLCGKETRVNWGDYQTVKCESCYDSAKGLNSPSGTIGNTSEYASNISPTAIALKWAKWPAAFGLIVGISAAMKSSGNIFLATILGSLFAAILGGITFITVFLVAFLMVKFGNPDI